MSETMDDYFQWAVRVNKQANRPWAPQPALLPCANNRTKVWVRHLGGYILTGATDNQRLQLAELFPEMPKE